MLNSTQGHLLKTYRAKIAGKKEEGKTTGTATTLFRSNLATNAPKADCMRHMRFVLNEKVSD